MGSLYRGTCYPSHTDVKKQACSQFLYTYTASNVTYTGQCTETAFTGATLAVTERNGNTGATSAKTIAAPADIACTYDGSTTMATDFFYAILGFVVVVWCASRIKNMFWRSHEAL